MSFSNQRTSRLSRRTLIKELGLMSAAATLLPSLRNAHAQTKPPKRFVVFYTQHGTLPWLWRPKAGATRTTFDMGSLLTPLEPWKKDLNLLGGVDMKGLDQAANDDTCGHARGQAGSLTAQTQIAGKRGNGISIDMYIANGLIAANGGKPVTSVPIVHAGILDKSPNTSLWGTPYHSAPGVVIQPEYNPLNIYNRLFPGGKAPSAMVDTTLQDQRKLVLDHLTSELKAVGSKLGRVERERLDQHATIVNDLKLRVNAMGGAGGISAACATPAGIKANSGGAGWWANTSDAVPKLVQAAFACDLTRVFCLQVEEPAPSSYGWTPGNGAADLHELVHALNIDLKDGQDAAKLATAKGYYTVHATLFAKLLTLLSEAKEADGSSVLSNTAVLWCGELAQPGHSYENNKWVLAGQLGGYLKSGQFFDWDNDSVRWGPTTKPVPSNGDLFTTIANGMGVPTVKFGHPVATKGEIAELKA